jgi:hypothetical protein
VTQQIFLDWYTNYFCPTVPHFCQEKKLPAKALLLFNNAPGNTTNFADVKIPLDVSVVYMPQYSTSALHFCITPLSKKVNTGTLQC